MVRGGGSLNPNGLTSNVKGMELSIAFLFGGSSSISSRSITSIRSKNKVERDESRSMGSIFGGGVSCGGGWGRGLQEIFAFGGCW